MTRDFRAILFTTATLASAFPVSAAFAQSGTAANQIEDIIVTTQRREESLQKVPVAVSAITADGLNARGLRDVEELSRAIPGLTIGQSSGAITPFLRGVGNSVVTFGNESSTAVYVDGVYYSRLPPGFFAMSNIQRVEVLKGPQGTLFGRNASGGVLQLVTKDPSHDTSVMGSASYGRFDLFEGNVYATMGISDTIAADISLSGRRQGKGYGRNLTTGHRANYMDDFTARTKWLFEASDATRITLSGFYSYSKVSAQGSTFPGTQRTYLSNPRTVAQPTLDYYDANDDANANFESNGFGAALKLEQELSFAKFTSISAFTHIRFKGLSDSDYGPRNDQIVSYGGPQRQLTQEFQLASLTGGALQWVAGLFYYNTKTKIGRAHV